MKPYKSAYISEFQHYYSQSQLLLKCYSSTPQINLCMEIDTINKWIELNTNTKPLLITAKQFGGKKTLLCQLNKYIQKTKNNYVVISQFASVTPYFAEIIYKITMKLRTYLNINQKIQLNEQKLRQYFKYWLQLSDNKIEKDYLSYSEHQKLKIVLIIEGIDKIMDSKNQQVGPSFWLPDLNLKNIVIILTAQTESKTIQLIHHRVSQVMEHVVPQHKITEIKESIYRQNKKLGNIKQYLHFADLLLVKKFIDRYPKFQENQNWRNFQQFFIKFVKYLSSFSISEQNIYKMLSHLIWSKYGLTKNMLKKCCKVEWGTVQNFIQIFKDIILINEQNYLILNLRLKDQIENIITTKYVKYPNYKNNIHAQRAKWLKKETNSVNSLQQLIYHLEQSQNYTELEQVISKVQNFLILYTPLTKHLLCSCWFVLEIHYQYDPVFQYNRSLEKFVTHYFPSPEDTFRIIFHLSLFFKEYSQFENSRTPSFRHPPIRGEIEHFQSISIYDELIAMNMHKKCKLKNKQSLQQSLGKVTSKQAHKGSRIKQLSSGTPTQSFLSDDSIEEYGQLGDIKQIQKLNINIKFHQNRFKNYYIEEMRSYINENYQINNNDISNTTENKQKNVKQLDEDSDNSDDQMDQNKIDVDKIKKFLVFKQYNDYQEEEYYRNSFHKHSFYYYKQWLWVQFPWICQSVTHNYSELIKKCMKNPTEYLPLNIQSKLIKEAIRIAKMAKYTKNEQIDNNINNSTLKNNNTKNKISEFPQQRNSVPINPSKNPSIQPEIFPTKLKSIQQKKSKFTINKFDEELKNFQIKQKKNEINSTQIFMTNIQSFQNQITDKENNNIKKFPHLNKNCSLSVSHISKNFMLDFTQIRDYNMLITKYDELKYENEQLLNKIQRIKQNRQTLQQNNKEMQKNMLVLAIQELVDRKDKIHKNQTIQQALKAKLQLIIKLCNLNKNHNSVSAHLNNFLNSIRFMVRNEQKHLQLLQTNIKKLLSTNKLQYKKLKQQKQQIEQKLQKSIKKSKIVIDKNYTILPIIENKTNKRQKSYIRKKNKIVHHDSWKYEKKIKIERQLELFNHILGTADKQLGLKYGQHEQNQYILGEFSQQIDKLNQIEWKLSQLIESNSTKQSKAMQLSSRMEISKGHLAHQKQLAKRGLQSSATQNFQTSQQRLECLLRCFEILDEQKFKE